MTDLSLRVSWPSLPKLNWDFFSSVFLKRTVREQPVRGQLRLEVDGFFTANQFVVVHEGGEKPARLSKTFGDVPDNYIFAGYGLRNPRDFQRDTKPHPHFKRPDI